MATALAFVGEDVTVVVRPEKLSNYPKELSLEQPTGMITASAHAVSKLTAPVDVLWVATKTHQLESALESAEASAGATVPLLNGVDHIAMLRSRFGHDRVIPATIAVEADRIADGCFAQRSLVRLSVAGMGEAVLGAILTPLHDRLSFNCGFVQNEETLLWRKLCFLAPFALTTSASKKDKGSILSDPEWKATLYSAINEAIAVATASGAEVELAPIQKILDTSPGTMRSSMLKDLIAGKQLELDAIGGPIVRGGETYGVPVPTTKKLMAMIESQTGTRHD